MKIIVTGGAGFIGENLCSFLLNEGHNVICIDDLSSGLISTIEKFKKHENFSFYIIDISSVEFPSILNSIGKVDQIYHLACPASPQFYQKNPIHTIQTCIQGTINILNHAKQSNTSVLLTSTSEIYGEPLEHPQKETYRGNVNTLGIRACYDESKRLAETLMMEYNRLYKLDTKIVRIFNTYGPNMRHDDGRVISNFFNQAITDDDITIYGDGTQTRSLCYIDDTVNGLVLMMNSSDNGPINIGNPTEYTINEISKIIVELTHSKSKFVNKPLPEDDPSKRCPDITKATKILNWHPIVSLRKGLQYFLDNKH